MTNENKSEVGADKSFYNELNKLATTDAIFGFLYGRNMGKSIAMEVMFEYLYGPAKETANETTLAKTTKIGGIDVQMKGSNVTYGPKQHKKWKNK